jgi:hypothetical protein
MWAEGYLPGVLIPGVPSPTSDPVDVSGSFFVGSSSSLSETSHSYMAAKQSTKSCKPSEASSCQKDKTLACHGALFPWHDQCGSMELDEIQKPRRFRNQGCHDSCYGCYYVVNTKHSPGTKSSTDSRCTANTGYTTYTTYLGRTGGEAMHELSKASMH